MTEAAASRPPEASLASLETFSICNDATPLSFMTETADFHELCENFTCFSLDLKCIKSV